MRITLGEHNLSLNKISQGYILLSREIPLNRTRLSFIHSNWLTRSFSRDDGVRYEGDLNRKLVRNDGQHIGLVRLAIIIIR